MPKTVANEIREPQAPPAWPEVTHWRTPGEPEAFPVYRLGETTTVFDHAWRLHGEGRLPVWGSVLARSQTKGRGRAGKPWCSPPGHVYAALRLPGAAPFDGPSASIALALLVTLALEELFSLKAMIKWPNDIVFERKKVGGLLLEARRGATIGGIGLNLVSPPVWAPQEPGLDDDRGHGHEHGHGHDHEPRHDHAHAHGHGHGPEAGGQGAYLAPLAAGALPISEEPARLWARLVEKMLICYNLSIVNPDTPPFGAETTMGMAAKRLLGLGHNVSVLSPSTEPPFRGRVLTGTLVGLDSSGALLIDNGQGNYAVWSGSLFFEF